MSAGGVRGSGWLLAAGLLLALAPAAQGELNKRLMKIRFFTEKSQLAYAAKDWNEAIKYSRYVLDLTPHDGGMYYQLACCQALAGNIDQAFDALTRSVELGWDDPEWMNQDTDLAALRSDARWEKLVAEASNCRAESMVVEVPANQPDTPLPLLIALHGLGGNAREFAAHFRDVAQTQGLVLAAPRGNAGLGRRQQLAYGWHRSTDPSSLHMEGVKAAVERARKAAQEMHAIDDQRVVLVGFSHGGAAALLLLAREPEKYAGAVLISPFYDRIAREKFNAPAGHVLRIGLITGENDGTLEDVQVAKQELEAAGHKVQITLVPSAGHEVPANHEALVIESLRFVLGGGD